MERGRARWEQRRRGRVIMSRVCGGKQSVAERASAHRIRVRDLAVISISHVRAICTSYRERNAVATSVSRNPRTARLRRFRLGSSLFRDTAIVNTSQSSAPPSLDPNTGLATVIYRALLQRLGDHYENWRYYRMEKIHAFRDREIDDKRWSNFDTVLNKFWRERVTYLKYIISENFNKFADVNKKFDGGK